METEDMSDIAFTWYHFTVREPNGGSGYAYKTRGAAEQRRQEFITAGRDVSEIKVQSLLQ